MDAPAVEDAPAGGRGDLLMAKISEIAGWIGVKAPALDAEITEVSNMEGATPTSLVFATDSATLTEALESKAGAILASDKLELWTLPADPRIVWTSDARYAFARVAQGLRGKGILAGTHLTAVIGEDVTIGAGTSIGPRSVLGDGVVIGKDCNIAAGVTIYAGAVLGDGVAVQAGAVLGSTGFGYVRNSQTGEYLIFPQQGRLVIENDVEIGANTTIDRGALGETRIGRGTKIDNLVHIGHNCIIGRNVIIAAQTGISGSSVVEDGAILGGQVGIGEHATVGAGVILGGGAGVLSGKKMRGPGEVFWGRPARPLKEYLRDLARLKKR
jgi:UDP-3-O-[3-hydroxymyristoyl] glucosamine N-acyltransferase